MPTATGSQYYGSYTVIDSPNLNQLPSSQSGGWCSAVISNLVTKATDYELFLALPTSGAIAPANDKAAYVYISPFISPDNGTTWLGCDLGTNVLLSGTEGRPQIGQPNDLKLLGVLNYAAVGAPMYGNWNLSNCLGESMPDGWSVLVNNYTAATLHTGCLVAYRPIKLEM